MRALSSQGGNTCVHFACQGGFPEILELLLGAGAELTVVNDQKATPLISAARSGSAGCLRLLLKEEYRLDVDAEAIFGWTACMHAANAGHAAALETLLLAGGSKSTTKERLRSVNEDGATLLHLAAKSGSGPTVRLLLRMGADHRWTDGADNTALHVAAERGQVDSVDALLNAGADVDTRCKGGYTALHVAAGSGRAECAARLLQGGADERVLSDGGFTPALYAAANGQAGRVAAVLGLAASRRLKSNMAPPAQMARARACRMGVRLRPGYQSVADSPSPSPPQVGGSSRPARNFDTDLAMVLSQSTPSARAPPAAGSGAARLTGMMNPKGGAAPPARPPSAATAVRAEDWEGGQSGQGDSVCSICLEGLPPGSGGGTATLVCGHRFHEACINSWLSRDQASDPPTLSKEKYKKYKKQPPTSSLRWRFAVPSAARCWATQAMRRGRRPSRRLRWAGAGLPTAGGIDEAVLPRQGMVNRVSPRSSGLRISSIHPLPLLTIAFHRGEGRRPSGSGRRRVRASAGSVWWDAEDMAGMASEGRGGVAAGCRFLRLCTKHFPRRETSLRLQSGAPCGSSVGGVLTLRLSTPRCCLKERLLVRIPDSCACRE